MSQSASSESMPKERGVLNIWDLPHEKVYVEVEESFKQRVHTTTKQLFGGYTKFCKFIGESPQDFASFMRGHSARLAFVLKIINNLHNESLSAEELQKNIKSASSRCGHKIENPKLPFDFCTTDGAIILASALHDGCITKRCHFGYYNKDAELVKTLKSAVDLVIGYVNPKEKTRKDGVIEVVYPNIVGYILTSLGLKAGDKTDNDVGVPSFLFSSRQDIISKFLGHGLADDGAVVFDKRNRTRNVSIAFSKSIWMPNHDRESLVENFGSVPQLLKDEIKLFGILGVQTTGPYFMKEKQHVHKPRFAHTWFACISNRKNLEALHKKIKIPSERKQKILDEMISSFVQVGRYQLEKLVLDEIKKGKTTVPWISKTLKRDAETVREVIKRLVARGDLKLDGTSSSRKPNIYVLNGGKL